MELRDAVAMVTGGTGGLGRRICRALAQQGTHIVVVYAQQEAVARQVSAEMQELGVRAIPVRCDVTQPEQVHGLVDQVIREFGRIDILVNDAAYNKWIPFSDLDALTLEDWSKILTVNLTGPLLCIKAVAPFMKRQGRGRIVNIASVAGLAPTGSSIAYAVSKAGLIHLTRCMAVALAPEVLVNCVAPGYLEGTRMTENLAPEYRQRVVSNVLLKRAADKDDVAEQVVTFCRTETTTGQTLVIDAGRIFH
ncbi:MAG: SDR family oxidoreductase [Nitrospinota bacterium]|nr:MAG: SDR family oxidoreductase [Nitrospinota bacterium]